MLLSFFSRHVYLSVCFSLLFSLGDESIPNSRFVLFPDNSIVASLRQTRVVGRSLAPCFTLSNIFAPTTAASGGPGKIELVAILYQELNSTTFQCTASEASSEPGCFSNPPIYYGGLYKNFGIEDVIMYAGGNIGDPQVDLETAPIKIFLTGREATNVGLEESVFQPLSGPVVRSFSSDSGSARYLDLFLQPFGPLTQFPTTSPPPTRQSTTHPVIITWKTNVVTKLEEYNAIDPLVVVGSLITIIVVLITIMHAFSDFIGDDKPKEAFRSSSNLQAAAATNNAVAL